MPYINLIQEQRLALQQSERKARSFFLIFVGALSTSALAYGFLSMETLITSRQIGSIKEQNKKNAPLVAEIDTNRKQLNDLAPRLKTLEDAQEVTNKWNRILNHLAVQTPKPAWLTGMRCMSGDPTKPIQVNFIGVAGAQSPVGEFIMRLQNLSDLENVNLRFTNEKLIANATGIEFQVDADLVGTAEQQVKKDEQGDEKK